MVTNEADIAGGNSYIHICPLLKENTVFLCNFKAVFESHSRKLEWIRKGLHTYS